MFRAVAVEGIDQNLGVETLHGPVNRSTIQRLGQVMWEMPADYRRCPGPGNGECLALVACEFAKTSRTRNSTSESPLGREVCGRPSAGRTGLILCFVIRRQASSRRASDHTPTTSKPEKFICAADRRGGRVRHPLGSKV